MFIKKSSLVLILSLSAVVAEAQVVPGQQALVPGQPVQREIAGGQLHSYQISLATGQFMRVVVEQKGMDVALALKDPNGKPLVESDLTGIIGASGVSRRLTQIPLYWHHLSRFTSQSVTIFTTSSLIITGGGSFA